MDEQFWAQVVKGFIDATKNGIAFFVTLFVATLITVELFGAWPLATLLLVVIAGYLIGLRTIFK